MSPTTFQVSRVRAFTLIELLTVIAIIGILAAIIIPVTGKVRDSAKNARCAATLREWGRAIMLYANDNRGNYTVRGIRFGIAGSGGATRGWQDAGENPYTRYMTTTTNYTDSSRRFRGCALNPDEQQNDYALALGSIGGNINNFAPETRIPLASASNPSQLLLMIDGVMTGSTAGDPTYAYYVNSDTARINAHVMPMFDSSLATSTFRNDAERHGGKAVNAIFGDGSLRRVTGTAAGQRDRSSILEMRETWFQIN